MSAVDELIAVNVKYRDELKAEISADRLALGESRKEIKRMERELDEKEAKLEMVDGHIKDLKSGGRKKSASKPVKQAASGPKQRNVNGEDVIEACVKAVSENPGMKREDLEPFVAEQLKEKLGMRGYDKRFAEAMKKGPFTIAGDEVWLSEPSSSEVKGAVNIPLQEVGELAVERLSESGKVD